MGDPKSNIEAALGMIKEIFKIEKVSSLYRTRAVGGPSGQPDFLNGAAKIEPHESSYKTMKSLLDIEEKMGRVRKERWGPRIIDLDILDYNGTILNEPELKLPHPRMAERAFVLAPLAEIAPEWRHPVTGLSASEMLNELGDGDRAVILGKENLQ